MLRLAAVGLISHSLVESSALMGIMARASAVDYDHRLSVTWFRTDLSVSGFYHISNLAELADKIL